MIILKMKMKINLHKWLIVSDFIAIFDLKKKKYLGFYLI